MIFERIMQTITTVGYGDNNVETIPERIVMIIIMSFTSGFIGFFIRRIRIMIINSSSNDIFFRNVRNNVRDYCVKHELPKFLRNKIAAYIRHLRLTYNNNLIQEEDIINLLSIPLREQIFLCTKGYILVGLQFFNKLSRPCIRSFGYRMSLKIFGPNDLIFSQGELSSVLYFVHSGSIQIYHEESKTIFIKLHKGNIFGEIAFLLKTGRSASARSANFSELYSLHRHEVDDILETMPKDWAKFQAVMINLTTYGISYIEIECYLCREKGHIAKDCSYFICKPVLKKRAFQNRQRINIEMSPTVGLRRTKTVTQHRYSVYNTKGSEFNPLRLFRDNFLARKSIQYSATHITHKYKYTRVFSLIDDVSHENSSNESERNCANFKYFHENKNNYKDSLINIPKTECFDFTLQF